MLGQGIKINYHNIFDHIDIICYTDKTLIG